MYCKHLSKTFQNGFKCKLYKKTINYPASCRNCLKIEPRANKRHKQSKQEKNFCFQRNL